MKIIFFAALAVACACARPASAHHEGTFGVFWKPGTQQEARISAEIWRYAFVSKYKWLGN